MYPQNSSAANSIITVLLILVSSPCRFYNCMWWSI